MGGSPLRCTTPVGVASALSILALLSAVADPCREQRPLPQQLLQAWQLRVPSVKGTRTSVWPCAEQFLRRTDLLRLKGGSGGASVGAAQPGQHSSVFLADVAARKERAAGTHPREQVPARSTQEILDGALRRETAQEGSDEIANAERLPVAQLRSKLRELGASDVSIRGCAEKRDLVELLRGLQNTANTVTDSLGVDPGRSKARDFQVGSADKLVVQRKHE